jgi:predicted amidohydrolase YtcJ
VTRVAAYATAQRAARARAASGGAAAVGARVGQDQAIDRKVALRMVTLDAAYFIGEEKMLGSIEAGKIRRPGGADGDYPGVPQDRIDEMRRDDDRRAARWSSRRRRSASARCVL